MPAGVRTHALHHTGSRRSESTHSLLSAETYYTAESPFQQDIHAAFCSESRLFQALTTIGAEISQHCLLTGFRGANVGDPMNRAVTPHSGEEAGKSAIRAQEYTVI